MTVRSLKSTSVKGAQKTPSAIVFATTAPTSPASGDLWFNTELGKTFVWYVDVDGSQWVEVGSGAVSNVTLVTSTTRPTEPFSGQVIFETDTEKSFVWTGSAWKPSGGEINVASDAIQPNSNTISENYTFESGQNGVSAGPITIASGVTVTVPVGSAWSIV